MDAPSSTTGGSNTATMDAGKNLSPSGRPNGGGARPRAVNNIISVEPPRREDLQPSYAQVLHGDDDVAAHGWYGGMINTLGSCIGFCGAIPCCVVCPNPFKNVSQGNVGLVTKFGRFFRAVDPGLVKINPLSERLIQVDVKIQIVGTCTLPLPGRPFPDNGACLSLRQRLTRQQRSPSRSA